MTTIMSLNCALCRIPQYFCEENERFRFLVEFRSNGVCVHGAAVTVDDHPSGALHTVFAFMVPGGFDRQRAKFDRMGAAAHTFSDGSAAKRRSCGGRLFDDLER